MFRSQPYLEKTAYVQVNLDTPLTYPGNNQTQNKSGHKFTVRDRDNFYDWYNAYFRVDFKFEAVVNGANIGADTQSAPISGSFSLIKSLNLKSHFLRISRIERHSQKIEFFFILPKRPFGEANSRKNNPKFQRVI